MLCKNSKIHIYFVASLFFLWKCITWIFAIYGLFYLLIFSFGHYHFIEWRSQESITQQSLDNNIIDYIHLLNQNMAWQGSAAIIDFSNSEQIKKNFINYGSFSSKSPFLLASVSKHFTATAITKLEKQGLLKTTDPVCNYIAKFCRTHLRKITLQHLMNHRSGLGKGESGIGGFLKNFTESYYPLELEELIEMHSLKKHKLNSFGKYFYSNFGFNVLSLVIERVEGKNFSQAMNSLIFLPNQLKNSFVYSTAPSQSFASARLPITLARDLHIYLPISYAVPFKQNFFGAGAAVSSTEDMLNWAKVLVDQNLLPQRFKENDISREKNYVNGWMILKNKKGEDIYWHNGATFGHHTQFFIHPQRRWAFVLLSNVHSLENEREQAMTELRKMILGKPYNTPLKRSFWPKFKL